MKATLHRRSVTERLELRIPLSEVLDRYLTPEQKALLADKSIDIYSEREGGYAGPRERDTILMIVFSESKAYAPGREPGSWIETPDETPPRCATTAQLAEVKAQLEELAQRKP